MTGTILIAGAVVLGIVWWVAASMRKKPKLSTVDILMDGAVVASEPFLSESELVFYNVLRLAVQDHYLIFAQVPLWSFVSLESSGRDKSRLLKHMALKRVDFALIHPGSRRVEQVVQIEEESSTPEQKKRQRTIELLVRSAGIKLVKVRVKKSYAIPELAALLNLATEE